MISSSSLSLNNGSSPWLRKPLWVLQHEIDEEEKESTEVSKKIDDNCMDDSRKQLKRHLTLFDLVSIGVGGTIGSGIFVLSGLIAREYAGPSTCISWMIAGGAATLSGCCYAELSGRIPSSGSSYAYVYAAMGELPAVIAAACLSLEYLVSGSAVARSWGDKMVVWLQDEFHMKEFVLDILNPGFGFNTMAFLVSVVSLAMLLKGVKESKNVTNIFTTTKVILVLYMILGGAFYFQMNHFKPFFPPSFGVSGMMRGATSSFFGYIGYDEVCCVAGEAINPQKNMPRAVMLTIAIVTFLTVFASVSLIGMQPYFDISSTSGFPEAFRYNDAITASQICAFGEIFTLPIVVLISLMAQPRLNFALAKDGLLPAIFGEVDASGNLYKGTLISGIVMTIIAAFMPFTYLDDLISGGILMAFCMTNSSLILMRHESSDANPHMLQKTLFRFNLLSFITGLFIKHWIGFTIGKILILIAFCLTWRECIQISRNCPKVLIFGGKTAPNESVPMSQETFFTTPFVPYLPCLGIFVNWYLIAQLELLGIVFLILYIGLATLYYFGYSVRNSFGNTRGWKQYETLGDVETIPDDIYARTISLPRVE